MSWMKMVGGLRRASDPVATDLLQKMLLDRLDGLPDGVWSEPDPAGVVQDLYAGWEVYPFPDYSRFVTARTSRGWAFLPSAEHDAFAEQWWAAGPGHRSALVRYRFSTAVGRDFFAFPTLGDYAEAFWVLAGTRTHSGLWAPLREFLTDEEFESVQLLYGLSGSAVRLPERLYDVEAAGALTSA